MGVWLYTVDHMFVCHQHVDHFTSPLVPHKDTPTVTPTQHPAVTKEVGLLDLNINRNKKWRRGEESLHGVVTNSTDMTHKVMLLRKLEG